MIFSQASQQASQSVSQLLYSSILLYERASAVGKDYDYTMIIIEDAFFYYYFIDFIKN
jgi:hypothetical protein